MAQSFASGISATNGIAQPSTCDTDTLETSTGPTKLRAEFTPEVINLNWYSDDGRRINVPNASNTCTYGTAISLPPNPTKPGYKFAGWEVLQYTKIEYIEGNGTQWIDTGIVLQNATYDTEVMLTTINERNGIIGYSYMQNGTQHRMSLAFGNYAVGRLIFGYGDGNLSYEYVNTGMLPGIKYHINARFSSQNPTLTINDVLIYTYNHAFVRQSPISIGIAGYNSNYNDENVGIKGRVYSAKIYDENNDLVGDFIPIKDNNGVPCMYDRVTGQFFYNAGTGNFVAGPEI